MPSASCIVLLGSCYHWYMMWTCFMNLVSLNSGKCWNSQIHSTGTGPHAKTFSSLCRTTPCIWNDSGIRNGSSSVGAVASRTIIRRNRSWAAKFWISDWKHICWPVDESSMHAAACRMILNLVCFRSYPVAVCSEQEPAAIPPIRAHAVKLSSFSGPWRGARLSQPLVCAGRARAGCARAGGGGG
jgi:hypothetical protein